jgi:hypothetical protein
MQNQQTSLEEIRRRIEHEDNLLNQRVSWIVSSQAFLLTGYAILLNAPIESRNEHHAPRPRAPLEAHSITSISITLLLWTAMFPASRHACVACAAGKQPGYEAVTFFKAR